MIWMPSDDEEEGRMGPTKESRSSTPAQIRHLNSGSTPPKSPTGRAMQGAPRYGSFQTCHAKPPHLIRIIDPKCLILHTYLVYSRGIGRHIKTPEILRSEELFTSLQDGKNVLSPQKYCTPPWVKSAQKIEQEMERSQSADPSMIWRPLSTAFDTELPEDSWAESWAGGKAATQPMHRAKPPPSPWKVATKEHASNPRRAKSVAVVLSSTHHHHAPRPGSRCNTWESCKRSRIIPQTTRPISVQDFHRSWVPDTEPQRPATAIDFNSDAAWQPPGSIVVRPLSKSGSVKKPVRSTPGPKHQAMPSQPTRPAPLPMASDMHQGSERLSMEKIQEDAVKHLEQRSSRAARSTASSPPSRRALHHHHHHPGSGGAPEARRHSRLSQKDDEFDAKAKNTSSMRTSGPARQPSARMQFQDEQVRSRRRKSRLGSRDGSRTGTDRHQNESSPDSSGWNNSTQPNRYDPEADPVITSATEMVYYICLLICHCQFATVNSLSLCHLRPQPKRMSTATGGVH